MTMCIDHPGNRQRPPASIVRRRLAMILRTTRDDLAVRGGDAAHELAAKICDPRICYHEISFHCRHSSPESIDDPRDAPPLTGPNGYRRPPPSARAHMALRPVVVAYVKSQLPGAPSRR